MIAEKKQEILELYSSKKLRFAVSGVGCRFHYKTFRILFQTDERCYSPNNTFGLCVILQQCPSLLSLYERNRRDYQVINIHVIEIARRNCGSRQYGDSPIVCCQDPIIIIQYPTQSSFQPQSKKPIIKPIPHSPVVRPPTYDTNVQPTGKFCRDPNGSNGVCMNIKECPSVLNEFVARFDDLEYIEFIKRSNRYCDNIRPFICCPDEGKSEEFLNRKPVGVANGSNTPNKFQGRFLTPEEGCGYSNASHLRIGGPHKAVEGNLFISFPVCKHEINKCITCYMCK